MKSLAPLAAIAALSMAFLGRCSGGPPAHLGVENGKLAPCPKSPNCVSTQSEDERHGIEALPFRGSRVDTLAAILRVVERMPRTKVVTQREDYVHVEYRTKMGFVDDVEFYFEEENRIVHFRSASRLGYSDMGLNRRRMEEFTAFYRDLP